MPTKRDQTRADAEAALADVWVRCPVRCVLDDRWLTPGIPVRALALTRARPDRGDRIPVPDRYVIDLDHPATWHTLEECPTPEHIIGDIGIEVMSPYRPFGTYPTS